MAVQVLVDHGVTQEKIVFVTYSAGKMGLNRLSKVFPDIQVVLCAVVPDLEERWIEKRKKHPGINTLFWTVLLVKLRENSCSQDLF